MKANNIDKTLVLTVVIAVLITAAALFFVTSDYSHITGRVAGESSELGDTVLIYIVLFLAILTAVIVVLSLQLSSRKKK